VTVPGELVHSFHRGRPFRRVGRIALLHGVIQDDAVVVVDYLGLVSELGKSRVSIVAMTLAATIISTAQRSGHK
jgi:hypothetical protein